MISSSNDQARTPKRDGVIRAIIYCVLGNGATTLVASTYGWISTQNLFPPGTSFWNKVNTFSCIAAGLVFSAITAGIVIASWMNVDNGRWTKPIFPFDGYRFYRPRAKRFTKGWTSIAAAVFTFFFVIGFGLLTNLVTHRPIFDGLQWNTFHIWLVRCMAFLLGKPGEFHDA